MSIKSNRNAGRSTPRPTRALFTGEERRVGFNNFAALFEDDSVESVTLKDHARAGR